MEVLYFFTLKHNYFSMETYLANHFFLNYDVLSKGFFSIKPVFSKHTIKLSFFDPCFWLILRAYGKTPDELFGTDLNLDFVSDDIQFFCRKIFEHESYVRVFFLENKAFSLYTNLNFNEPKFDFVKNWENIFLGSVFDFVVWFFLVDLSKLGPITNYDSFFYLKYVVLLQYNFKIFFYGENNFVRFFSYKIILFCLIKLGKIFKKKFEDIKSKDFSLKSWEEIFFEEFLFIKKIFKNS